MTEVVAALIWDKDKFMICQRPAHKARGLLWEFVGGKVEPGETKEQALIYVNAEIKRLKCRPENDQTPETYTPVNHQSEAWPVELFECQLSMSLRSSPQSLK